MKSERWQDLKSYVESNRRLVVAVAVALIGLGALQNFIGQANLECLGFADSKETTIAFETPVVVKRIFVMPGQVIRKGQPLVEVEPVELNLKYLEVMTELESLRSEKKVRDSLMSSFGKTSSGITPIEQEILGLQAQADELRKQQAQAVRYAEEDGVVATVNFRAREQVAPFLPVITLTSNVPNMVYGFIHENRLADFRVGDQVLVESITTAGRFTNGKVIALGNRITAFPERMQTPGQVRPTYFGRELVVSLPSDNQIMMGERVRIRAEKVQFAELSFQAFAAADDGRAVASEKLADALEIETSGMVYLPASKSLLVGSDDDGPNGSPFWLVPVNDPAKAVNIPMIGLARIDDVESVSASAGKIYALSSLSKSKKDKVKFERNIIARLTVVGDKAKVDRALDMRTPMLDNLKAQPLLRGIWAELDNLEVEGFSMDGNDAFLALKEPRFQDGTSVVLKVRGLAQQIELGRIDKLDLDIYSMVKLDSQACDEPSKITDLIKTKGGLVILSNCRRSEKTGQIWFLRENAPPQQVEMLTSLKNGRPEAMAFGEDFHSLYVGSDNGNKKGSDLIKVQIPNIQ